MKKLLLVLLVIIMVILFIPAQVLADTGTYKIDNYSVTLTPQSDGSVDISYYQQWTVLSGNIPWITVGLPNTSYTIISSSDNVSNIRDDSSSGWDGVYIALDRTYYANQSFTILFTINDRGLLTESTDSWGINFTPGWYDNAVIDVMDINLDSPISPSEYTFNPPPTTIVGSTITWEKTNLPGGSQFNVSFNSTDGSFILAGAIPVTTNITSIPANNGVNGTFIFFIVAIVVIFLAIVIRAVVKQSKARAAYASPEVSPIGNKKYLGSSAPLEDQKKELDANKDKVDEYIISEKDKIPDAEKAKQISDYAQQHNLSLNGDNYVDNYGHSYNNNLLWMLIMMNSMHTSQTFGTLANNSLTSRIYQRPGVSNPPTFNVPPPSCHCACVACACACACACAGGHAAGCTIKLKNIKTGNSDD